MANSHCTNVLNEAISVQSLFKAAKAAILTLDSLCVTFSTQHLNVCQTSSAEQREQGNKSMRVRMCVLTEADSAAVWSLSVISLLKHT